VRPVVLKLGGSLLTYARREGVFSRRRARRLAEELAAFRGPLVVVHGTGSFGKPPARRFGYLTGRLRTERAPVVSKVEGALDRLRGLLLEELRRAGVRAVGVSPASLFECRAGSISRCETWPLVRLLQRGLTPVTSGGILPNAGAGFTVCSSDDMAAALAMALPVRRLIFATDARGALSRARSLPIGSTTHLAWLAPDLADVSGGMRGKLEAARAPVRLGIETLIVNGNRPYRVHDALAPVPSHATRLVSR
jgi:isopentenyl phosphate kinase